MSSWLTERVPIVAPRRTDQIGDFAEYLLAELQPEALSGEKLVDLVQLIDFDLPPLGVHFSPEQRSSMHGTEAKTQVHTKGGVDVIIDETQWHQLLEGGPLSYRSRTTVAHELGHVFLHVPELRRRPLELARATALRADIPAFRDPEWQAWTFCHAFLMPPSLVRRMRVKTPAAVSARFGVSEDVAKSMLKRFSRFIR